MKNALMSLLCVTLGLLAGALILKLSGIAPLEAYQVMLEGTFSKPNYLAYVIVRSTPLILTGVSVAFAFRTGLFNIGAEGQFIIGALVATYLGFILVLPFWLHIPIVLAASMLASGLYGGISGFLKARFGVHEVLSTIMLNWIALYLSNFLLFQEGFRRPDTEASEFIQNSASITLFEDWKISETGLEWLSRHEFWQSFLRPSINAGIFLALIVAVIIWFVLKKTTFGFKLKAVGLNPTASEYAGINVKKKMTYSMMIAGAISGLAGATHVMGVSKNVSLLATFEGYGFDGIAVSLIGGNHPLGVVLSAFFLGAIKYSGSKLQSALDAPSEVIGIMIGVIIFFIAMPKLFQFIPYFKTEKKS